MTLVCKLLYSGVVAGWVSCLQHCVCEGEELPPFPLETDVVKTLKSHVDLAASVDTHQHRSGVTLILSQRCTVFGCSCYPGEVCTVFGCSCYPGEVFTVFVAVIQVRCVQSLVVAVIQVRCLQSL